MDRKNPEGWEALPATHSVGVYGPLDRGCHQEIARCCGPDRHEHARLIAAAPTLLEACDKALTLVATMQAMPPGVELIEAVREALEAAIAKATSP